MSQNTVFKWVMSDLLSCSENGASLRFDFNQIVIEYIHVFFQAILMLVIVLTNRSEPLLLFPENWFYPFHNIVALPTGVPGKSWIQVLYKSMSSNYWTLIKQCMPWTFIIFTTYGYTCITTNKIYWQFNNVVIVLEKSCNPFNVKRLVYVREQELL